LSSAFVEQGFGDGQVLRVGDLDVALAARDDVHVDVRQVTKHDAAVVGRGEVRVGGGELMGAGDHREPEALRGLAAQQPFPARHRLHHPVVGDDHGVRRRHRDPRRVVHPQRSDAFGDYPLIHQRPRGIVQQHAAVVRSGIASSVTRDSGQGRPGRVRPGRAALDDPRDLEVAAVGEHGLDLVGVPARHHDQDLVDVRCLVEGGHAALDQRLPAQGQQLLRRSRAESLPHAAAEHHPDHPHERDSTRPAIAATRAWGVVSLLAWWVLR
jgi:hypothetical protein